MEKEFSRSRFSTFRGDPDKLIAISRASKNQFQKCPALFNVPFATKDLINPYPCRHTPDFRHFLEGTDDYGAMPG